MRSLQIIGGKVVRVAIGDLSSLDDWIIGDANVGDTQNPDGTFTRPRPEPLPEPTAQDKISGLEISITPRNLRMAALGDAFAIGKIREVENAITLLRAEL